MFHPEPTFFLRLKWFRQWRNAWCDQINPFRARAGLQGSAGTLTVKEARSRWFYWVSGTYIGLPQNPFIPCSQKEMLFFSPPFECTHCFILKIHEPNFLLGQIGPSYTGGFRFRKFYIDSSGNVVSSCKRGARELMFEVVTWTLSSAWPS